MASVDIHLIDFGTTVTGTSLTKYYMMRWKDVDAVTLTYRTWTVTTNPDPTGIQYTGPKSGGTAISGAVVASSWEV
jgi:hypothetical protein